MGKLQVEADHKAHQSADSFVVCVTSHGGNGYFNTADNQRMTIKDLTTYFDGSHCRALSGKPKLFVIDACRGGTYPVQLRHQKMLPGWA